jgi:hypothetical protein
MKRGGRPILSESRLVTGCPTLPALFAGGWALAPNGGRACSERSRRGGATPGSWASPPPPDLEIFPIIFALRNFYSVCKSLPFISPEIVVILIFNKT